MKARKQIESLLQRHMGLNLSSIGPESFDNAVKRRMTACGASDVAKYLKLLQGTQTELGLLCEEVVVCETWFFRDGEPFVFLKQKVLTQWLPKLHNSALRVLSIPCSSGEEAYSIAMTLLNAGLTPRQFHLDAVDISRKALSSAQRAVYSKNSFRGDDLSYRPQYFEEKDQEFHLKDLVRKAVHFKWGNLADPSFLLDEPPYHAVFCRNLLIYFDSATREQAFKTLERLLIDSGVLFLGHAEILHAPASSFKAIRHPKAFACCKIGREASDAKRSNDGSPPSDQTVRHSFHATSNPASWKGRSDTPLPFSTGSTAQPQPGSEIGAIAPQDRPPFSCTKWNEKRGQSMGSSAPESSADTDAGDSSRMLDSAAALADRGRLDEAATLCNRAILEYGACARAYLLLGLVCESAGDTRSADEYFNKAVYLDPGHHEALIHLALLAEKRGDLSAATLYRRRASRVEQKRAKK
jgi:chemotaxis protein methyltransferase WspC